MARGRSSAVPSPYAATGVMKPLGPPVGGWNARDPLATMKPADAVVMDNLIPGLTGCRVRRGKTTHATGLGDPVETVMAYDAGDGSSKLFAAIAGSIFDVTSSGPVGSAAVDSLTNGRWQSTMFATSAGQYLYAVNGADSPRHYDGSAWATPSLSGTGLTTSNLITVASHGGRLWFAEKSTLNAWYLDTGTIAGTLTKLPLGSLCQRGGELMAIGSWSRDGGAGPDDYLVFVTSNGEVLVYAGTDPSATDGSFGLVGRFTLPPPIGRRCLLPVGSDLALLTSRGLMGLSSALPLAGAVQKKNAITNKIVGAFQDAAAASGGNFGWQAIEAVGDGLLIVNVPVLEHDSQVQFVMNAETGAWCRFTGLEVNGWGRMGSDLYAGDNDGNVIQYGPEFGDDGDKVQITVQAAYQLFGTPANKRFTMAKPTFLTGSSSLPGIEVLTDYDSQPPTFADETFADSAGSAWDSMLWDEASWGDAETTAQWQVLGGFGSAASIAYRFETAADLIYQGANLLFEPGGIL